MALECRGREKIYTYGPIIHNPQLVNHLAEQGVKVTKTLENIDGSTVILRSHGVNPEVYQEAQTRNIQVLDATCPHVKKAQQEAQRLGEAGYTVVVIGEKDHPEVQGIIAWAKVKAYVVETIGEAKELIFYFDRLGVVVQTTFSLAAFEDILTVLAGKCEELSVSKTICNATEMRQQAALELASQVDVMLVLGGKNSANTTRLASLCRAVCPKTYHIETMRELRKEWLAGAKSTGVTAGASTPEWIIEEVVGAMQEMEKMDTVKELQIGDVVSGTVVGVKDAEVFVDIGYKSEGIIVLAELAFPVPESHRGCC